MMKAIPLLVGYGIASLFLFFYTYTQVDLSLTLSRVSIWQTIEKAFQYVGYYERPLSTGLYIAILVLFFILYILLLSSIRRKKISKKNLWSLIFIVTVVLVLSYPAFSYDMFNYMFTAKTVLVYHKNPYTVLPLEFSGFDPMLSFMRWTHLPSAYTPLWILLTLPSYLFGFGYFLTIMWNLKILVGVSYLACAYFIGKILDRVEPEHALLGVAIFAFNPLVIIESLVSAHNDVVMMAFAMAAFYFFLVQKRSVSYLFLSLSVALKLMTLSLYPIAFLGWNRALALVAVFSGFVAVLFEREVLPWYWVWVMPFIALLPRARGVLILGMGISLGLLLRYAPVLYFGHYNDPVLFYKNLGTIAPIILSLIVLALYRISKKTR